MNLARMSLAPLVLLFAVSCGGQQSGTSQESVEADKKAPGKKATAAKLAPAGTSGLIPAERGFIVFDNAKLEAATKRNISLCGIDGMFAVKGVAASEFKSTDTVTISGWVLNASRKAPEKFALVLVGDAGSYAIAGRAGKRRPDVSKRLKSQSAVLSGFSVKGELASVAPGEYGFRIVQDSGEKVTVCASSKRRIIVSG